MDKINFLQSQQGIVFATREFAFACNMGRSQAVHTLNQLAAKKVLVKVTRGIWANINHPFFSLNSVIPLLLKKEQGYLSFLSALHRHGILSQIPRTIQIATTGRARILRSQLGTFEFFHLHPRMFSAGVDWAPVHGHNKSTYLQASAEKALLDIYYLATRKSKRFAQLPELEVDLISDKKFKMLLKAQVPNKSLYSSIVSRWESRVLSE